MKKTFLSALMGLGFIGAASAADITVYYSPTCPHCHHAREFIGGTMVYEYPELKVTEVNVMNESSLQAFRDALEKCKYDNGGVPVIVIGEKCFQGYGDSMQQELRDAVEVDMSDEAKAAAAENKKAMESDAEKFKSEHADRVNAISEYVAPAASEKIAEKKTSNNGGSAYFYALLVILVAALGFVLIKKDNKK